jgi:hypothetical protein
VISNFVVSRVTYALERDPPRAWDCGTAGAAVGWPWRSNEYATIWGGGVVDAIDAPSGKVEVVMMMLLLAVAGEMTQSRKLAR